MLEFSNTVPSLHIGDILDIKDSVDGVHSSLVLRSLANEALLGGERDERRRRVAPLLIRDWKISAGNLSELPGANSLISTLDPS